MNMFAFEMIEVLGDDLLLLPISEKVAGELSDALTAAFSLGVSGDGGDDSYKFDEHFWIYLP